MRVAVKDNVIKLRGIIWNGDGEYVSERIETVQALYNKITYHINGYGGSVFDGNLIYNTMLSPKHHTSIRIDSVACSMYSVLLMAGAHRSMASNAFVMIHAPSGFVEGTAEEMEKAANLLRKLEDNFVKVYMSRTGKAEKEVRKWLVGDNWFSATEAKAAGLIDEIYDPIYSDDQVASLKTMDISAAYKGGQDDLFSGLVAQGSPHKDLNQKSDIMKKEIIAKFSLVGVSESSSDTAVIEALATKMEGLENTVSANALTIDGLEKGQTSIRENMIAKAVKLGSITAEVGKAYESVTSIDVLATMLEGMTPKSNAKPNLAQSAVLGGGATPAAAAAKTFNTWEELKKEPRAMEQMKANDFDSFNALFKAKYGKDFKQ